MRTARVLATAVAPLLGAIVSSPATAQSAITGVIVDANSMRPVAGATVSLRPAGDSTITQADGAFRLPAATGRLVLETRHLAYATRSDTVVLREGQNARVQIPLVATAIELPPISVQTRSRRLQEAGFFGRMERGIGTFVTRTDLDERNTRHLSDVVARVPGLRRSMSSDGSSSVSSRGGRMISHPCNIQYFIDGVRSELGAAAVDGIPVEIVEGIEIYRGGSEVPTQFDHGRSVCGAILVWTRRGG